MTTEHFQISDDVDTLIVSLVYHLFTTQNIPFDPEVLDIIIHSNPSVESDDLGVFFEWNAIKATTDDESEIAAYMTFGKELCEYVSTNRRYVFRKNGMASYILDHS